MTSAIAHWERLHRALSFIEVAEKATDRLGKEDGAALSDVLQHAMAEIKAVCDRIAREHDAEVRS